MTDTPSAEEVVDPLSLFPEEWREPVTGLLYLGKLIETVKFCGHTFTLKTLLPQEKFTIGVAIQPWRNTIVEVDVWEAAHVASALMAMDNDTEFCPPLGPDLEMNIQGRLNWLIENLYPPTITYLWEQYSLLEGQALFAMKEIDRLLKGGQPINSPPWLDPSIASGSSLAETGTDTPSSTPSNSNS